MKRLKKVLTPKIKIFSKNIPKHVIVNLFSSKTPSKELFIKRLKTAEQIIFLQPKLKIPILTINLMSKKYLPEYLDILVEYFYKLKKSMIIHQNSVRISALGKWYDLPGRVVEPIKEVIDDTKDYDTFFLNFCINYSPREEITDASKIIARKIEVKKLSLENVDNKEVKDNLYSSSFLPAELIIEQGDKFSGTLLWDSVGAKLHTNKSKTFTKRDFLKVIRDFQKK